MRLWLLSRGWSGALNEHAIDSFGLSNRGPLADLNGKLDDSGYGSPPVFLARQIGLWTFVATVYDRGSERLRHYINGRCASEHELALVQALQIGPADIGNWGVPMDAIQTPIRNFNGRIDVLTVFNTALTPELILELYQAGQP